MTYDGENMALLVAVCVILYCVLGCLGVPMPFGDFNVAVKP